MKSGKYVLEKNFTIYLVGKLITAGMSILSIALFIRFFGEEQYGKYILYFTTFLMCLSGGSGWLIQGILRFYSLEHEKERLHQEINELTIKSTLLTTLVMAAILYVSGADLVVILLALVALYFAMHFAVYSAINQAQIKSVRVVIADVIRALVFVPLALLLHFLNPVIAPVHCLFIALLISFFLASGYLMKFKFNLNVRWRAKTRWKKIFFKYGMPLGLWMVFAPTTNGIDRYIIEYSIGAVALAQYSALYEIIFKLFSQLSIPFNNIVQPMLVNSYNEGDKTSYRATMLKAMIYLILMFLCVFVVVWLLRKYLVCNYLGFCGEESSTLIEIVIPLMISSFIWQVAILFQKNLETKNQTGAMAITMLIVTLLAGILGLIYVPQYGYRASAYLLVLSSVVYLVLIYIINRKLGKR